MTILLSMIQRNMLVRPSLYNVTPSSTIKYKSVSSRSQVPFEIFERRTMPSRSKSMVSMVSPCLVFPLFDAHFRLFAQQLLKKSEIIVLKKILLEYTNTRSLPKLCENLKPLINSVKRLPIIDEIANRLPQYLREDFQKLRTIYFTGFNNDISTVYHRSLPKHVSKVIAQDHSGTIRVLEKGHHKSLVINGDITTDLKPDSNQLKSRGSVSSNASALPQDITDNLQSYRTRMENTRHAMDINNNLNSDNHIHMSSKFDSHTSFSAEDVLSSNLVYKSVHLERTPSSKLGLTVESFRNGDNSQLRIKNILPQSNDNAQGLKVGDIIVSANGRQFENARSEDANSFLQQTPKLHLQVLTAESHSTQQPLRINISITVDDNGSFGFSIGGGAEVNSIPTISHVYKGSSADLAGLKTGDSILTLFGVETDGLTHKQIVCLATSAKLIKMVIERQPVHHVSSQHSTLSQSRQGNSKIEGDGMSTICDGNQDSYFQTDTEDTISGQTHNSVDSTFAIHAQIANKLTRPPDQQRSKIKNNTGNRFSRKPNILSDNDAGFGKPAQSTGLYTKNCNGYTNSVSKIQKLKRSPNDEFQSVMPDSEENSRNICYGQKYQQRKDLHKLYIKEMGTI